MGYGNTPEGDELFVKNAEMDSIATAALREIGYSGYYNVETMLKHFGEGFEECEAEFAVKVLDHMLKKQN